MSLKIWNRDKNSWWEFICFEDDSIKVRVNAIVRGKPMIKERGASDMLKGVGHLLSLIANGVELILIIRIYEKQGIMMLSLKQTKLHWSYDLKSAWIRSVIAVKVALEGW